MPTYEFECQKCGNRFSLFTTVSGRLKAVCPACQSGNLQQLFTGVSFVKGSSGGDSAGTDVPRHPEEQDSFMPVQEAAVEVAPAAKCKNEYVHRYH
jgi:putative FmdB family regulatory protein